MDESRRIWRDRVARWHKSEQSSRMLAEREGVNAGTLYSWSRRLAVKRSEYRLAPPASGSLRRLPPRRASTAW